jgi:hypothetical protein
MGLKFLIIVPHGYCDETLNKRHCDRRALGEAKKLQTLIKSKKYSVDFFTADKFRHHIDYNRKQARYSIIRNEIRDLIKKYSSEGHHIVIFEIHSFPDNYTDYNFSDTKMGFISIPRYAQDMYFISEYINNSTGLKMSPTRGTETNDIQWDSSETVSKNINHYLVEFRENKEEFVVSDAAKISPVLLAGAIKRALGAWSLSEVTQLILIIILFFFLYFVHTISRGETSTESLPLSPHQPFVSPSVVF